MSPDDGKEEYEEVQDELRKAEEVCPRISREDPLIMWAFVCVTARAGGRRGRCRVGIGSRSARSETPAAILLSDLRASPHTHIPRRVGRPLAARHHHPRRARGSFMTSSIHSAASVTLVFCRRSSASCSVAPSVTRSARVSPCSVDVSLRRGYPPEQVRVRAYITNDVPSFECTCTCISVLCLQSLFSEASSSSSSQFPPSSSNPTINSHLCIRSLQGPLSSPEHSARRKALSGKDSVSTTSTGNTFPVSSVQSFQKLWFHDRNSSFTHSCE